MVDWLKPTEGEVERLETALQNAVDAGFMSLEAAADYFQAWFGLL